MQEGWNYFESVSLCVLGVRIVCLPRSESDQSGVFASLGHMHDLICMIQRRIQYPIV